MKLDPAAPMGGATAINFQPTGGGKAAITGDFVLIADEVVCGFGRLGPWFASDLFGMQPDLITVAKGVTSAYAPLSGCIVSKKVDGKRVYRIADGSHAGRPVRRLRRRAA